MAGRPIVNVHISSDFAKAFRKLPDRIQRIAEKKDRWFRADAFDARLDTHKLKGALAGYWAYSLNRGYRVLFRFVAPHEVLYYDVGTHEIYR